MVIRPCRVITYAGFSVGLGGNGDWVFGSIYPSGDGIGVRSLGEWLFAPTALPGIIAILTPELGVSSGGFPFWRWTAGVLDTRIRRLYNMLYCSDYHPRMMRLFSWGRCGGTTNSDGVTETTALSSPAEWGTSKTCASVTILSHDANSMRKAWTRGNFLSPHNTAAS